MRPDKRLVIRLTALSGLIAFAHEGKAQPIRSHPAADAVLQVPYVAQSELLCGGAALAMVERWWGRRGVSAEEFAHLVRPVLGGILTSDLVVAAQNRGWQTSAFHGRATVIQQALRDSAPVVALIRVARNRYHYVVLLGWDADRVIFHDPAVAPFRSLKVNEFLKRWDGADQWALVVRPPLATAVVSPDAQPTQLPIDSLPCRPWLDEAVEAAGRNQLAAAERLLASATTACPSEPLLLRELAGVRFRQGRQVDATRLAGEYLRRAPADTLAWQLLASSRYLAGDELGALEAWNRVGRPILDLVVVAGSERIRFRVLADAITARPGRVLTPERFVLAQRRIADVPALALANVRYVAVPGGVIELRAAVVERPLLEPFPRLLIGGIVGAAVRREVNLTVATPFGAGERWSAQWRWDAAHPRRAIRLDIPARIGVPGVVGLEGSREEYRFGAVAAVAPLPVEQRGAASLEFGSWVSRNVEILIGARFERWSGSRDFLPLTLGGALHTKHDRVVLLVRGERAVPLRHQASYARMQSRLSWRPPVGPAAVTWSARIGIDWASSPTPRGLWPIAGGDLGRAIPLRAHALIVDGQLPTARSSQRIVSGGLAADRPLAHFGPVRVGIGVFVDAAEVRVAATGSAGQRRYLDGGAGLRFALPGAQLGALRIDLARGFLADPRWGLSVGLEQPWPPRPRGIQ